MNLPPQPVIFTWTDEGYHPRNLINTWLSRIRICLLVRGGKHRTRALLFEPGIYPQMGRVVLPYPPPVRCDAVTILGFNTALAWTGFGTFESI